jgi:hypothetical protein
MTDPVNGSGKTEVKVKAATIGAYLASTAGLVFLANTATDFVESLPDWLETIVYPVIPAAITFLAGYQAKSKAGSLARSTIDAARAWVNSRMPHNPAA